MRILFRNGLVFLGHTFFPRDVAVSSGSVSQISQEISPISFDFVVDLKRKYMIPGLADVHVHLREPGFSLKETIETGTQAAARGGFTTICAMPNVIPAPDHLEEVQKQIHMYQSRSKIQVRPYACITQGGTGHGALLQYAAMQPYVVAFSDDGNGVVDRAKMQQAMEQIRDAGGMIAAHCEDRSLTNGGYIHAGSYAKRHGHPGISSESEWRHIARDLELVAKTGCPYHVCHISAKESVRLIGEAKQAGLPVSCETAPHYLTLTDEAIRDEGRFRMSPPIRSKEDQDALIAGIVDGTIDMIATDHAPHTNKEKEGSLKESLNGVVGLETSLSVMYSSFVKTAILPMERLITLMCTAPRKRFSLGGGEIKEDTPADFTIFDPDKQYTICSNDFLSKGRATPWEGNAMYGEILFTISNGTVAWDQLLSQQ